MKITCSRRTSSRRKVTASSNFGSDPQYLMSLADEIESILYTDFDIEASAYSDGAAIHITTDIDDEDETEGLITEDDLAGLTGDLETDAYNLAEDFYSNI